MIEKKKSIRVREREREGTTHIIFGSYRQSVYPYRYAADEIAALRDEAISYHA
jgi:hypothetical protein